MNFGTLTLCQELMVTYQEEANIGSHMATKMYDLMSDYKVISGPKCTLSKVRKVEVLHKKW